MIIHVQSTRKQYHMVDNLHGAGLWIEAQWRKSFGTDVFGVGMIVEMIGGRSKGIIGMYLELGCVSH